MGTTQLSDIQPQEDILITYIEDQCIYGQLTKFPAHTLWQIHRVILATLPENRRDDPPELQPGARVAVNVEDMFLRAVVLEAESPEHVLVYLLDVGTKDVVHTYGIRPLSAALDSFAQMAVRVVLRAAVTVTTEEIRTLTDIEMIYIRGEPHLLGTLLPSETSAKREYATVPAFTLAAETDDAPQAEEQKAPQAEKQKAPQPGEQKGPQVAAPPPAAPIRGTGLPDAKPKVPQALTLGCCQIEVIDAPNGRTATVRRANSDQSLKTLESKLVSFSSKYRAVSSVEVGDYLLALYGGEGHWWSRALVHEISEDLIQVEYVDYAIYDFVPRSNIRELPRCFCQEAAHVATVDFSSDVEAGRIYNVVISAKLDGRGRLFAGYLTENPSVGQ